MYIVAQHRADAGYGAKERLGIERAAQAIEAGEPARAGDFVDRGGKAGADCR